MQLSKQRSGAPAASLRYRSRMRDVAAMQAAQWPQQLQLLCRLACDFQQLADPLFAHSHRGANDRKDTFRSASMRSDHDGDRGDIRFSLLNREAIATLARLLELAQQTVRRA